MHPRKGWALGAGELCGSEPAEGGKSRYVQAPSTLERHSVSSTGDLVVECRCMTCYAIRAVTALAVVGNAVAVAEANPVQLRLR